MLELLKTNMGRLRILGFLEGASLLVLIFICMPLKYVWEDPLWVKIVGPIHGALFILYVFNAITVSIQYNWKFMRTFWVILASFIPFGTFYADKKVFSEN